MQLYSEFQRNISRRLKPNVIKLRRNCLKGNNMSAQGNALGIGFTMGIALKGRNKLDYIAPSGLNIVAILIPRALPWASIFNPFGVFFLILTPFG